MLLDYTRFQKKTNPISDKKKTKKVKKKKSKNKENMKIIVHNDGKRLNFFLLHIFHSLFF